MPFHPCKASYVLLVFVLMQNGVKEVQRLQAYLGTDHSEARLSQILEKCGIDNLRNDVESLKVKTPVMDENGKSITYRKGMYKSLENIFYTFNYV